MKRKTMILINPPVHRPCEPPAGIAKLLGSMKKNGVSCRVLDANLEGLIYLLANQTSSKDDTWSKRSFRNLDSNLSAMRNRDIYKNIDRYSRTVKEINRVLNLAGRRQGAQIGLANYQDKSLSPLRSSDLIESSEKPDKNPYYLYFMKRLTELFNDDEPALVGISLTYLSQALHAFSIIGLTRKLCPDAKIVLGGGLVTSWLSNPTWKEPFAGLIDHIIAGPGEIPLLKILGIEDFKSPALPDYSPFRDSLYLSPGFILPYSASEGCYWSRCTFCPEKAEGSAYAQAPIHETLFEIKSLIEIKTPSILHLLDNAISPALLEGIVKSPPGVPWYGFARITRRLADPDFCLGLKRSGCVMLKIGLESGDQGVLDALEKGIDLSVASTVLKNLKAAGIGTYIYLLFGTPAETGSAAQRTLDYVAGHHEYIDYLNLAIFNMPAYGPDAEKLDTEDFYSGDLTLYRNFRHPQGWSRSKVRRFLEDEFKRDPAIRSIILKDPPVFTSNHAPFFLMSEENL